MASRPVSILALNGGSSSIKFAVYDNGGERAPLLHGKLDWVGLEARLGVIDGS
jgi:acetate kinase